MQKLINWCKKEWVLIASCFFVAFIPLYPKLPLFDIVQTWVYVRIEDMLVAIVAACFVLMLWRRKLFPDTALTIPIIVYWGIGLISLVFSMLFIGPKLLSYFPHLAVLHYVRRVEYMFLFFLGYYALAKKPSHLYAFIWTLALTSVLIIAYGIGQKFLGFPAFLTMNEEFAKGLPLRLPPTARIASTFGGHYDLGAYLVMVIPIFGSLVFGMQKFWQKLFMFVLTAMALVLLLFTASRISFLVYLVAISTMLVWKKRAVWIVPVVIVSFVMLNFVSSASERFYKTFRFSDVIVDLSTGQPIGTLDTVQGGTAKVETQESPATENLPKGSGFIGVTNPASNKPSKTIKTIEYITSNALATGSGEIATISGSFLIQKAFVYDISLTTRFQAEWPMAIAAFSRNYLLGSGFSTLSVATDGDYFRMLGETGILGTIAFLGIFMVAFTIFFAGRAKLNSVPESFVVGVFAGLVGLFLNAILIDVFEASKVAFSAWLIIGAAMATLASTGVKSESYLTILKRAFTSKLSYLLYILAGVFIVYKDALSLYFMGDDFTWLRWAASTPSSGLWSFFTSSAGFFYRPIPKLLYFALYSVFWLKPVAYHVVSLLLFFWLTASIFLLLLRQKVRVWIALVVSMLFISLSVHHEVVYWISTYSHQLSAALLFSALLFFDSAWRAKRWNTFWWMVGTVSVFASAMSYEGGTVSPVIAAFVGYALYGVRSLGLVLILAMSPLYWWLRSSASAEGATGNYGVKSTTLLVNALGNGMGYIFASFFGPKVVEIFETLRNNLRHNLLWISSVAVGLVIVGIVKIRLLGMHLATYKRSLLWAVAALLSMVPFLGLGGMTERYALVPSALLMLSLGESLEVLWSTKGRRAVALVSFLVVLVLAGWNYSDLMRVKEDWKKASAVSETTILALKANFFPLQNTQAFVFVNTPIRYGRAWIFPTGLTDGMWHMFKFNNFAYSIYTAGTVKEAFEIKSPQGVPFILEFDNFVLKRVVREIKTITEEDEK